MTTTPPTAEKTTPAWIGWLITAALTVGINIVLFSFYTGKQDGRITTLENRVTVLEAERARREARDLERVYEYEKAQQKRLAEMEAITQSLKSMPPTR